MLKFVYVPEGGLRNEENLTQGSPASCEIIRRNALADHFGIQSDWLHTCSLSTFLHIEMECMEKTDC